MNTDAVKTVDDRSLSLALWDRSFCLMQLGYIDLALNDLQLSIKVGLPDEHRGEFYARLAECYHVLGDLQKAKITSELAKKLGVTKVHVHVLRRVKDRPQPHLPALTGGEGPDMKEASSVMKAVKSQEMGRYMIAKEDINTGDTLVVEKPYVACLVPESFGSHCHHCFKR